jgi:tRNA threonylcarbamoyladenosine biosynthesis protein TsaB
MRRLIIDTATRACSVALFDGDSCIASFHENIGRGHAERLIPMISDLPDNGHADAIYVNVGPGSFTGIRVGVSAARALALAWNADCCGYGCLNLVAAMAVDLACPVDAFAVAMAGGHGELFVQFFDADGHDEGQQAVSLPMDQAIAKLVNSAVIAGDAAEQVVTAIGKGQALPVLPDAKYWNRLAHDHAVLPPSPFYARGADAKLPGGVKR